MEALALKRESDNYWNLIKDASNEVKLALIKRLSDALRPAVAEKKAKKKKYTADDFAGIWDDEHFMAAEDINKAIRDARQHALAEHATGRFRQEKGKGTAEALHNG